MFAAFHNQSPLITMVQFTDIIRSSVPLFAKKKQKWLSHTKKHAIYGPGLSFLSVLYENGTVSDRYESNSCRVSDRDEVKRV